MKFISITHCSAQKSAPSEVSLNGTVMSQSNLEASWLSQINKKTGSLAASNLYKGRGFQTLLKKLWGGHSLYVVSAGLGLVNIKEEIPSYDCTISSGHKSSLDNNCSDKPNLTEWWRAISTGQFSSGLISELKEKPDFILISLTLKYLKMVEEDLRKTDIVKIIFTGPSNKINDLGQNVIRAPYANPLDGPDSPIRGTKSDFAQRCHSDFLERLRMHNDLDISLASVEQDMTQWRRPKEINNQKFNDAEILRLIIGNKDKYNSVGKLHKYFRHELKVACEQKRFTKLYRQAFGKWH